MRYLILTWVIFSGSFPALAQQTQDNIIGTWINDTQDAHIEIYEQQGVFYGKIVWLKNKTNGKGEPITDRNNPDKSLRNQSIIGLEIISGLRYNEGKWIDGTIYSPKRGQTLDCSATLTQVDTLSLKVSKSFFSATKIWKRL